MELNAAFKIGDHEVCQDYALASSRNHHSPSMWISDGCSSSKGHTDVGARLLVHFALKSNKNFNARQVIEDAHGVSTFMRLQEGSLDATLLGAVLVSPDKLIVHMHGDGVLAMEDTDGNTYIHSIEFSESYPEYLNYELNAQRKDDFFGIPNNVKIVRSTCNGESFDFNFEKQMEFNPRALKYVALFSDGVHSFKDKERDIPYLEVLAELLKIRNPYGEFVARRMTGFTRTCKLNGWKHHDDISMACMYF